MGGGSGAGVCSLVGGSRAGVSSCRVATSSSYRGLEAGPSRAGGSGEVVLLGLDGLTLHMPHTHDISFWESAFFLGPLSVHDM